MLQFHFLESIMLIIDLPEFSPTFKKMWQEISIIELGLLEKSDCGMKLPSVWKTLGWKHEILNTELGLH